MILMKVIKAKNVINCAGLWGDEVENLRNSENSKIAKSDFNIQPKKGQFLVYEKIPTGLIPEEIIVPVYDEIKQTKVFIYERANNLRVHKNFDLFSATFTFVSM